MKTAVTFFMVGFFFAFACFAQNLDTIKLSNLQSVLNNRAFFTFPQHAQNSKRSVDIMSVDPNANEETRVVLDLGTMRLVFFAHELFTLADNNFIRIITEQNEKAGYKVKTVTDRDGLQSVLSTPVTVDSTQEAILINDLLVKMPDQSVFRIDAYINSAAMPLKDQFTVLTMKVFQTLQEGNRKIDRSARQEKRKLDGTSKSLLFNLPKDYFVTIDNQYDFQVFKLHKYQTLGDASWQQLIIYAGYHPSPLYKDYNLSEKDATKSKGNVLKKAIDWWTFNISGENFIDKEQLIPFDTISKGMILHIAMMSNEQRRIDELTKLVEAIQITN